MNFELTAEQAAIQKNARQFVQKEIKPLVPAMEKEKRTPWDLILKMRKLDFYGIQYSKAFGGVGGSYIEYVLVMEEISKAYCSIAGHISVNNLCAGTINDFGTLEQKRKYLPQLLTGDAVGSFAFTESETGSDPKRIQTTAVKDKGEWIINGHKLFITNATLPGFVILFCKDVEKENKITAIIIPKDAPGYRTSTIIKKMGMHGLEVADIYLDNVRVPYKNTVGGEDGRGKGFKILTTEISMGKLGISAQCVGMAQAALNEAVVYAKTREQQGKPIGDFGTIQWMIGEMSSEIKAARLMTLATAFKASKGKNIFYDAASTRLFTSQVAHRAASNAMQIMGAYSYTKAFSLERIFRDMKLAEIYEGVNEIQRVISASELLKRR